VVALAVNVQPTSRFAPATATATAAVLWGTVGPLATQYPAGGQYGFAFVRNAIGALVLVLLAARHRRAAERWTRRDVVPLATGAVGVATYQPLYFHALDRTGVGVATFVAIGLAPVATGVLWWLVGRRAPGGAWWTATAVACAGVAVLSTGGGGVHLSGVGLLLAAGATFAYTLQAAAIGMLSPRHGGARSVAAIFALGAVLMVPGVRAGELSWVATPSLALGAVYAGLGTLAAGYALFAFGVDRLGSPAAVTISLLEPVAAAALGAACLGERVTALSVLAFAVILAGVLLAVRDRPQ